MCLDQEQIQTVEEYVQEAGINYSHLEEDLVDHLCCDIESRMREGIPFHEAYREVQHQAGYNTLSRIQRDTLFLIDKNYRMMKKSMKTLGIIALVMMALGSVAKIMHWPGASILLTLSFLVVGIIFYPAVLYVLYKEYYDKKKVYIPVLAFIGGLAFMWGVLFKIQHWPGAGILMTSGEFLLIVLLAIIGLSTLSRQKKNLWINITGTTAAIGLATGLLFKIQHWPGAAVLLMLSLILFFILFIPAYTYKKYSKADFIDNRFIFIIFAVSMIAILTTMIAIRVSEDIVKDYKVSFETIQLANSNFANTGNTSPESNELNKKARQVIAISQNIQKDLLEWYKFKNEQFIDFESLNDKLAQNPVNSYFTNEKGNKKARLLYEELQAFEKLNMEYSYQLSTPGVFGVRNMDASNWIDTHFVNIPLIAVLTELEQIEYVMNLTINQK